MEGFRTIPRSKANDEPQYDDWNDSVSGVKVEIEAKFYLPSLDDIRETIKALDGHLCSARVLERNLRFDTANRTLSSNHSLLRLRQDRSALLTFKHAVSVEERTEIEVGVEDFDTTRALLERLGYEVYFIYEKYRETYALGPCSIMLDELPFGHFIEIEGNSLDEVKKTAAKLNLPWKKRVRMNYLSLFHSLKQKLQLRFRDATFDNFSRLPAVQPDDLDLKYAQ
jgi:adenylate cyclase class 2